MKTGPQDFMLIAERCSGNLQLKLINIETGEVIDEHPNHHYTPYYAKRQQQSTRKWIIHHPVRSMRREQARRYITDMTEIGGLTSTLEYLKLVEEYTGWHPPIPLLGADEDVA